MTHLVSKEDNTFKQQVECCEYPTAEFDHRAHLRLAYIYLTELDDTNSAVNKMSQTLLKLLRHAGIEPTAKFHKTLTKAWILAVYHFLNQTDKSHSADDFIAQHPLMLDTKIMLTHYSAETLFSETARAKFVEPNLEPIPRYDNKGAKL